jgi:hypothetical protein
MVELAIGTSAEPWADSARIKEAGIGWLRQDFPFPFADRLGGALAEDYLRARATAQTWAQQGLQVMGVTPLVGSGGYRADESGTMRFVWHDSLPAWMGVPGSAEYNARYQEMCSLLAEDLRGIVQMWQITNEMDIEIFAGPVKPRQACDLILGAARGLKGADPSLVVGTNTAGSANAYYMYGRLYADPAGVLDYCGVDGYYGSWIDGGPENWAARIVELYELTGRKVLVNEWGFASKGAVMSAEERQARDKGASACQFRKWPSTWDGGHTLQAQAEYVRLGLETFRAHREVLLGAFFYRWEDQERCWQCGSTECPLEIAWGLVDVQGQPKPAYFTFKEGIRRLLA